MPADMSGLGLLTTLVLLAAPPDDPSPSGGAPPAARGTPASRRTNIVPNPGFEKKGVSGPARWGMVGLPEGGLEVDGLTSFWVREGVKGSMCLKVDTNVNLSEAQARWAEVRAGKRTPPRPKGPTRPPYYNTVGGNDGMNILSDFIPVKPGMAYDIEADVKTTGTAVIIFVRGYAEIRGERRQVYKYQRNFDGSMEDWAVGRWVPIREKNTFHPTRKTGNVRWIRVSLFAYWPVGTVWFDNVGVYENPNPAKYGEDPPASRAGEDAPAKRPGPRGPPGGAR